jgi:superfamily II DNA or RNA helicase
MPQLTITITIRALAELSFVDDDLDDKICDYLTINNPKWLENQKMGRWQGQTPKQLSFYEQNEDQLFIPRGAIEGICEICDKNGVEYNIITKTKKTPNVHFNFKGRLKPFQEPAANDILKHDIGTLCAPTGSGKTVMALYIIAQRQQPALIIVHTKELLNQWIDRINAFLGIPKHDIGIIGGGNFFVGKKITVALIQTLRNNPLPEIGHLICDEAHRTPSTIFHQTIKKFNCKYLLGLSATPFRNDGLTKLIHWYVGPVRHKIDSAYLMKQGNITAIEPIIVNTNFVSMLPSPKDEYPKLLSEITKDKERNELIASNVIHEARQGEVCLVLTDRKEHCEELEILIQAEGLKTRQLTGSHTNEYRAKIVKEINSNKINILIATGQLIGEGFDCKNLSALFLTTPIKYNGRLIQYIGRVLRPKPGKERAKIYDYFDRNIKCLWGAYKSRKKVYEQLTEG